MDFRKLIDALDSFNSEAKEKVREPYTIAKAIQDINNIAVSEPSKADTKYSSANIKRFADKKTEIAYKIRELSSRIKNNDELSIYLSDLANMITGDPHNIKERPTQQHMDLIKTAISKHKEMETPKDPDSDIPYDDNADDDDEPKESGIMYKAGVKKYGKDGMKKIQSAAGKGASAEEIGKIKDQHNKKKSESIEEWFQGQTDVTLNGDEFYETFGWIGIDEDAIEEAEYQGRKVKLGKPMRGDVKKFKVYVKNPKGNIVKVNFGDPDMKIKKSNPKRRKSFRARHNCDSPGPRHKARYWSCRKW